MVVERFKYDENAEYHNEVIMMNKYAPRKGRVTVSKSGQLWVVKIGGREVGYGRTKAIATQKANGIRKAQGKARR